MRKFYLSYDYRRISNWINICDRSILLRIIFPYYFLILIRPYIKKWKSSWMFPISQIRKRIHNNVIRFCHQNISDKNSGGIKVQALVTFRMDNLGIKYLTLPLLLLSLAIAQRPMVCLELCIPTYKLRDMSENH